MYQRSGLICHYLKGSDDGATCGVVKKLVRVVEGADIRLCMSRHFETCSYYMFSLRKYDSDADVALTASE